MTQKRALITGATGFVGSHLTQRLVTDGWCVHVITRPDSRLDQLNPVLERVAVHRFSGDIEAMRDIVRAARPTVVLHTASLFLSEHQPEDIQRLIESNLLFGSLLVEAMTLEGVFKLVNTGTSWQHYENRPYSPANLYAATKQGFEALLQYYVEARGLRTIALELFDTYGAGDSRKKLINLLVDAARTGVTLSLTPGDQSVDLVHVADVADAFANAIGHLHSGERQGRQRYCVSSGQPITIRKLVLELERALEVTIPVNWGGRPYRPREIMSPSTLHPTPPGWRPRISLHDGLKTLKWHD